MTPGLIGAPNGNPELGKFEPHHFHILYTHIKSIMQKNQFQQKKKKCPGLHLDPHYRYSLFLKILRKIVILTSVKGHNSVECGKISCVSQNIAYTKFHQNPSICSQDIKWKQISDIYQGP